MNRSGLPRALLALLPILFPLGAWSRPLLPEPPLGTGSASFAGGGAAHASGLNSVFDNPAALSIPDALQAEAGMMGLSAGASPYFLFGAQAGEKSSYALGYFYDSRYGDPEDPAPPRQGLIAGASWQALPWAALGLALRTVGTGAGIGLDGFGIDEDAGLLLRPHEALRVGLAVRNLQESGTGLVPEGFRTRRHYALALGTGAAGLRLAGLDLHAPDAYYELRSAGLPPDGGMAHAFSLGSGFTPGGKLGFRGTLVLPHAGSPGFALGTFLNLPLDRGALTCGYTFQAGGFEETGEAAASHSISVHFRLGNKLDPLPPEVEVKVDKASVSGDTSEPIWVHFRLTASDKTRVRGPDEGKGAEGSQGPGHRAGGPAHPDEKGFLAEGRIQAWTLILRAVGANGLAGREVKSFQGRDLPPRVIRWDARDAADRRLPPGFYAFRLEAEDASGNLGMTAWQLLEIRAPTPAPGK